MKIKYVWHDEPQREKIYDTIKAFEKTPYMFDGSGQTQEKFDQYELQLMEKKKKEGLVLSYEVIEDEITE